MPLYHFNIDGSVEGPDRDGTELDSLEVAKCEAIKLAGQVICESAGRFWDRAEWSMTVTDERGLALFTLHVVGTESPSTHAHARPVLPAAI